MLSRMDKVVLFFVFVVMMAPLSHSLITITQASTLAQSAMHSNIPPTSNPGVPSIVNNVSYYVMEFGDSWIPVNSNAGKVVTQYNQDAYEAVYLHQFAQLVSLARKNDGYPTKLANNLISLQGSVESKMVYYNTFIPQLPSSLVKPAQDALSKMKDLDSSIKTTLSDMDKLKKIEDYMFTVSVSSSNETAWMSTFSKVLTDISNVVMTAYSFDDARSKFVSVAAKYVQNDSNDIQKRTIVANFISDCGIDGIPSTLPNYKNIVSNWNSWLGSVLSKSNIEAKARQKFMSALDNFDQIKARNMKIEAYAKVSAVKTGFESVESSIGWCVNQLPYMYRQKYSLAKDYYNKSLSAYNNGSFLLNQSNYTMALLSFQDAIGWAQRLAPLVNTLSTVKCPAPKPASPGGTNFIGLIQRNWIAIVSFLVIILGVIYFFQSRPGKGRKQLETYYSSDDYSSNDLFDDQGPSDVSDLFKQ